MKTAGVVIGVVLTLALGSDLFAQDRPLGQEPDSLFRVGLTGEKIVVEPDAIIPGRYTLYWEGWVCVEGPDPEALRFVGQTTLDPPGQWVVATATQFGVSHLTRGQSSFYEKFAVAHLDVVEALPSPSAKSTFRLIFEKDQKIKVKLSAFVKTQARDAVPVAEATYTLRPLGYGLIVAATAGDIAGVRDLLDFGVDVDSGTVQNWTALMAASSAGHRGVVRLLLDKGANVNVRGRSFPFIVSPFGASLPGGYTALMAASYEGRADIVSLLLAHGAKVNHQRSDGWTPPMLAAYGGNGATVRLLLNRGAQVGRGDNAGYSPLALARINGNVRGARLIKARGGKIAVPWDAFPE